MNAYDALQLVISYALDEQKEATREYLETDSSKDWRSYARAEYLRGMANGYAQVIRELSRVTSLLNKDK